MNQEEPRLFSNDEGVLVIRSETKNRILDLLKEKERYGSQIREELDMAKSTISVHLSDLKELGIIDVKEDPSDERKKIYHLSSQFLGKSKKPYDETYNKILENLSDTAGKEYEFLKSLFHLIRHGIDSFGLDIHPALKEMGRDVGRSLGKNFDAKTEKEFIEQIKDFWKSTGLGEMKIEDTNRFVVKNCFDCGEMPEVENTLCSLDEGIIEGLFEEVLGKNIQVREKECHGTGHDYCAFEIIR